MTTLRPGTWPELTLDRARPTGNGIMQLPDEVIEFSFVNAVAPPVESWTPLAELQSKQLIARSRWQTLAPSLTQIRGQIASEREIVEPKPEQAPLYSGFIDLPTKLLESFRRKNEASELGRVLATANRLREEVDRVVVLGTGGASLGPRALFEALLPAGHNELPSQVRTGKPRLYFEGEGLDNDALQDLLELFENTCIDPELREERWGAIVIGKSGDALETSVAFRTLRAEAARFYGSQSPRLKHVLVPVAGAKGPLRELCRANGYADEDIATIPEAVGEPYAIFTPAGLLPAAVMGLDVRALLMGAAAMTRRFLEEPPERNPVLQFAAIQHLMSEELGKNVRVLAVWSKKLVGFGRWYEQLVSQALGKQSRGPTPLTAVLPQDLFARGQHFQDGPRDKFITNIVVRTPRGQPVAVGMADHNEDGLNAISRKTYPELLAATHQGVTQAYREAGRPTADLTVPALSEHVLGQLMQMFMLATVVEGRLMGINPYGEPGMKAYRTNVKAILGIS